MQKHLTTLIFVIYFLLESTCNALAYEIPNYDVANETIYLSDFNVGLYTDTTGSSSIKEIASSLDKFKTVNSRYAIKSITPDYWLVFNIYNSSENDITRIVGFDEVFMQTADIYYLKNSAWYFEHNGLTKPINERIIKNRYPVFNVTLKANETKTIYLKLHSDFPDIFGLQIADNQTFQNQEQVSTIGYWSYFGAALVIVLLNIIIYIFLRERIYLYYILYVSCLIVFILLYSGFSQYLVTNLKLHYVLHSSISLMGVFLALFTRKLLNTKELSHWIDKIFIGIAILCTIISLLIIYDVFYYLLLTIVGVPLSLFLLFTGVYSLLKKTPIAKFYITASSCYLIGIALISAVNLGLAPYNFITRHGYLIGSFIEMVVFALALGYRIQLMMLQKNRLQGQQLEAEHLLTIQLEEQVARRTKELIQTNEKLEKLNIFKEDMTKMMVHDLKTPINVIVNSDLQKDNPSKIGAVQQAGYGMLRIVENILDIYKYEQTEFRLYKTEFDIDKLIKEALTEYKFKAKQKSIQFSIVSQHNYFVKADDHIIKRIISNLLSNAVKHSPVNGTIDIIISLSSQQELIIQVLNEGVSIPKDHQEYIFKRFGQVKDRQNDNDHSSGLGLTFCKMAVEAHGGSIGVVSEPNEKVEFWFKIPNAQWHETVQNNLIHIKNDTYSLSEEDKIYLTPFINQLKTHQTYNIWHINQITQNIEPKNANIESWLQQIEDAVFSGDDILYYNILNLISGEN